MKISKEQQDLQMTVYGDKLKHVEGFAYLGGQITENGRCDADIKRRTGLTFGMFNNLSHIWTCHNLTLKITLQLSESMVMPVLLYSSKCLT